MEISWLGHSCFNLKGKEATVVTDPFEPDFGYLLNKLSANVVTLSHLHPGHSYAEGVDGNPKVLRRPGEYEVKHVFIIGFSTFHDKDSGKIRGKNVVYLIEMDGFKLCHLGDLGHQLSPQQIEEMSDLDVLFVPVGGVSTIDAREAAEVVHSINPRVIIPMHYQTEVSPWLEPLDKFLKEMGVKEILAQPKISFTRTNLPTEPQVVVLSYENRLP
jgi:L-ascorbate metabolism protein UlaG (beta-lactamase superfamily)